jgi:hypothetical protein
MIAPRGASITVSTPGLASERSTLENENVTARSMSMSMSMPGRLYERGEALRPGGQQFLDKSAAKAEFEAIIRERSAISQQRGATCFANLIG